MYESTNVASQQNAYSCPNTWEPEASILGWGGGGGSRPQWKYWGGGANIVLHPPPPPNNFDNLKN